MISGIKPGNLFVRAAHPWRFDVTDKDKVIVEDEITDLGGIFPPQSLSELIKQMTSPPIQTRPPYPAPLEDLQIKTEPTQGSTDLPYPSP